MFERVCPKCKRKVYHTIKGNRDKAERKQQVCRTCGRPNFKGERNPFYGKHHTSETKIKLSLQDNSYKKTKEFSEAVKKGMNGKTNRKPVYLCWLEKYGKEEADRRMEEFRKKESFAFSGRRNPMYGKPAPKTSGKGWQGWYKNKFFFRSIRELNFILYLEAQGKSWESAEKEEFRVDFINYDKSERTYYPDFLVNEINKKIIYEIKPRRLWKTPLVKLKIRVAIVFFRKQNITVKLVDPGCLNLDILEELITKGIVRLTDKTKERIKLWKEKHKK